MSVIPNSQKSSSYRHSLEKNENSNTNSERPPSQGKKIFKQSSSSSLEILEPDAAYEEEKNVSTDSKMFSESPVSNSRPSSRTGSIPPRLDSPQPRRQGTPTKQVCLQAVKRKEESEQPIFADVDLKDMKSYNKQKQSTKTPVAQMSELSVEDSSKTENTSVTTETKPNIVNNNSFDNDNDDDEDDDDMTVAPNQLMMEFLSSVMDKDFKLAAKLCKMILLYEPDNPEALKFQPLIDEKIQLDEEEDEEGGESGAEDDDDDDDESNSDESDSDDSDDDTDDNDSEEQDGQEVRVDSGIASASD